MKAHECWQINDDFDKHFCRVTERLHPNLVSQQSATFQKSKQNTKTENSEMKFGRTDKRKLFLILIKNCLQLFHLDEITSNY